MSLHSLDIDWYKAGVIATLASVYWVVLLSVVDNLIQSQGSSNLSSCTDAAALATDIGTAGGLLVSPALLW